MNRKRIALALTLGMLAGCGGGAGNGSANAAANAGGNGAAPAAAAPAPAGNTSANRAATQKQPPTMLALATDGLQVVDTASGSTRTIAFGRPMDGAVAAVSRTTGERATEDGTNSECGAGPARIVAFGDGLQLLAQDDRFAGWEVDEAGHTTQDGIGVGTTRAVLNEAQARIVPSTLGTEWSIGEGEAALGGLLSDATPNGRVTALWAGLTCHFR